MTPNPDTPQTAEELLRKKIKQMLDNKILDWDKPSQLTTIDSETNYTILVPAILSLIKAELGAAIGSSELLTNTEYGLGDLIRIGHRDELRTELRNHFGIGEDV